MIIKRATGGSPLTLTLQASDFPAIGGQGGQAAPVGMVIHQLFLSFVASGASTQCIVDFLPAGGAVKASISAIYEGKEVFFDQPLPFMFSEAATGIINIVATGAAGAASLTVWASPIYS